MFKRWLGLLKSLPGLGVLTYKMGNLRRFLLSIPIFEGPASPIFLVSFIPSLMHIFIYAFDKLKT